MFTPTSGRRGHTPGPLLVMPDDEDLSFDPRKEGIEGSSKNGVSGRLSALFHARLSLSQNQRHIPREEERSDEEEQQDSHIDDLPPPTRPKISRIPIGNLKDDRAVSPSPHEKSKRTTPRSPRAILSKLIVKDGKGSGHVSNRSSSSSSNVTNTSPRMVNNGPTSSSSIGTISEPSPRLQSRAIHSPRGPRGTDGSLSHPITLNFDAIERGF